MYNAILMLICIIVCFSLEILVFKFFKKEGLFVWIGVASILANILICKQIEVLGYAVCLGSVMFGSNFLATDILTLRYGKKEATKGVVLGLFAVLGYILVTQLGLAFIPSEIDLSQDSMKALFTISARVSLASVFMYFVSNIIDIYIFDKLRNKIKNKLWISNNVATIISNVGENFIFAFLAFGGIFPLGTLVAMQIAGSIVETVIALFDTPFLYLSRKIK